MPTASPIISTHIIHYTDSHPHIHQIPKAKADGPTLEHLCGAHSNHGQPHDKPTNILTHLFPSTYVSASDSLSILPYTYLHPPTTSKISQLCAACDADIHSANPLARRHTRITILPLNPDPVVGDTGGFLGMEEEEDGEEDVAFWLLGNPVKTVQNNNWDLFGDEYLDFIEYNSNTNNAELNIDHCNKSNGYSTDQLLQNREENREEDSIVPVQFEEKNGSSNKQPKLTFQLGLEHDSSKSGYGYPSSMSQSVSISSMDVGVVPQSTNNEVSNSHTRPPKGTIDLFTGGALHIPAQLTPMDREARVLRYREKKKTRKFQKTIRYASRKAYAETRPRIKGRFAKRTEFDVEVDQMFYCNSLMSDTGYDGIVPSF